MKKFILITIISVIVIYGSIWIWKYQSCKNGIREEQESGKIILPGNGLKVKPSFPWPLCGTCFPPPGQYCV